VTLETRITFGQLVPLLGDPATRSAVVQALRSQGFSPDSKFGGSAQRAALALALTAGEGVLELTRPKDPAREALKAIRRQLEDAGSNPRPRATPALPKANK